MTDPQFTPQQIKVLHAAATGMGRKAIAHRLGLTTGTVRYHLTTIYAKTGISGPTGERLGALLTAWAINHGYGARNAEVVTVAHEVS